MLGKYTSFQNNGNSVVDYRIVSDGIIESVLFFNTCKYLHRLLTSSSELLQSMLKESCVIANHKRMSWVACVEFLLKQIRVSTSEAYLLGFSSVVKRKLISRFKANLTKTLSKSSDTNQGKLRTYAYFKTIFKKEKYLSIIKYVAIRK